MTKKNDGGPAFSLQEQLQPAGGEGSWLSPGQGGMSLRDYFAGQALAGAIAMEFTPYGKRLWSEQVAIRCYLVADAMLALAQKTGGG